MTVSGKSWGRTTTLLQTPVVELHALEIKAGGYCSKHLHRHKVNGFYVISGRLEIDVYKNAYDLVDKTTLTAGEFMVVSPTEYHQFRALTDVECLELYYPETLSEDIVRENVGGVARPAASPVPLKFVENP